MTPPRRAARLGAAGWGSRWCRLDGKRDGTMATRDLVGLVRQAVEEIWNRGDRALAHRLFAADFVNHGGLLPDLVRGPEAVKVGAVAARLAFPHLRVAVVDIVGDGETVALRWTAQAAAPVAGYASEPRAGLTGATFSRFADGR